MNNIDKQLQIDRMVDGELSTNEQRQLLMMCDSENRWRELALAYVESQVFAQEMSGFVQSVSDADDNALNVALTSSFNASGSGKSGSGTEPTEHNSGSVNRPTPYAPNESDTQSRTESSNRGWSVMSLAAVVLLSLGFGYGLGLWLQGDTSPQNWANNPSNQNPASTNVPNISKAPAGEIETMPFLVSDSTGSEMKQVDLPLVNASDLSPNWQEQLGRSDVPPELLHELRANGIKLRQQRTMTRVRLPDGRLVLVPIDYFYQELFQ